MKTNGSKWRCLCLAGLILSMHGEVWAGYKEFEMERLITRRDRALREVEQAKVKQAKLKADIEELSEDAERARVIQDGIDELVETRRQAEIAITAAEPRLKDLAIILTALQDAYRIGDPDFTEGEDLGTVVLVGGRTLKGAVLSSFGPDFISVRHAAGVGRFDKEQLPEVLAKRFPIHPILEEVEFDLVALLLKKPNSLKTSEQILADQSADLEAAQDQRRKELQAAKAKKDAELKERIEAQQAENAKRREEMARATELREQQRAELTILLSKASEFIKAIHDVESQKYNKVREMTSGNIRPAQKNIDDAVRPYDERIQTLKAAKVQIERQITELRAKMR